MSMCFENHLLLKDEFLVQISRFFKKLLLALLWIKEFSMAKNGVSMAPNHWGINRRCYVELLQVI